MEPTEIKERIVEYRFNPDGTTEVYWMHDDEPFLAKITTGKQVVSGEGDCPVKVNCLYSTVCGIWDGTGRLYCG